MRLILNDGQQNAFNDIKSGTSIFLTGAGGVGKSVVLQFVVDWAKTTNKNIGVCASTGVSAVNLPNGRTVHSYLSIGLAKTTAYNLFTKARKNSQLKKKLNELQILIIDEVSMISAELFDKISEYLSLMRGVKKPFGGLQLVLCGDMCQLPPVGGEYCFKSESWPALNLKICTLKVIIRQEKDDLFKAILEEARFGRMSDEHFQILKACKNNTFGEIRPTILYSKNVNVNFENEFEYQKLVTGKKQKEYTFQTDYVPDTKEMREWAALNNIPSELKLCVGAQCMVVINVSIENGVANGTRCMVTGFTPENDPIVVLKTGEQFVIEKYLWTRESADGKEGNDQFVSAMPLRLAYALTIHKSQGSTLDACTLDIGRDIFEFGQAYTGLSRSKNLNSVKITSICKEAFKTHPDVLAFYGEQN